jgi:phosphoribosylformylglycinamidine synthase II
MASKGGSGIELDLDKVPQREANMTAYDMMLSESQERMLAVLKPGAEEEAARIFEKWELDFAVIGVTTDTGRLIVKHKGAVVADMPVHALAEEGPVYNREYTRAPPAAPLAADAFDSNKPIAASLMHLLASPDLCSRRWVWEQYDYSVMADTVQAPGGDAAVVRVHNTKKSVAVSTDVTPRYCKADPYEGGKQAVAECWRNLSAVGATPLAVTDNLNFGNPTKQMIMGEIVSSIDGIAEACNALSFPVVSGNCSLYNETNGEGILPTPAIGGVGLIKDNTRMASLAFKRAGDAILLVGEIEGHLGQSLYLREIEGREEGSAPHVDLAAEKRNGNFVRGLIENGNVDTVHDISDGGLLIAVAEMAMAGGLGAKLESHSGIAQLFGEDQACYVLAAPPETARDILNAASESGIPATLIGATGGTQLEAPGMDTVLVAAMKVAHETWLPAYMNGG